MIIFGIIFLYMLFNIFAYFRKDHVQFYEVMEGGIVNNKQYTGLILREEQVRNAQHNGYIIWEKGNVLLLEHGSIPWMKPVAWTPF